MPNMKTNKKVVIIDYRLGNLFSVNQACKNVGMNVVISSNPNELINADALILPGVGAFKVAMDNLKKLGLDKIIIEKVKCGTPIFGICLGLQLLFSNSFEFENSSGLNLIEGKVVKLPNLFNSQQIRVPHISWSNIYFKNKIRKEYLENIEEGAFMYFVHSFHVIPTQVDTILTTSNYMGINFCSSIIHNNIFATQFHPEKSGELGLRIYFNWANANNLI